MTLLTLWWSSVTSQDRRSYRRTRTAWMQMYHSQLQTHILILSNKNILRMPLCQIFLTRVEFWNWALLQLPTVQSKTMKSNLRRVMRMKNLQTMMRTKMKKTIQKTLVHTMRTKKKTLNVLLNTNTRFLESIPCLGWFSTQMHHNSTI